ncbi:transcriptional regulator ATRX-like [Daphnia carinata]|uniref:transcriptional regulator ATRX-like n=1 Tax=Daphnia carinata TaxID=120202 RepID=UPI002868E52D|nr:transcriptional regulator ATRX-like [Daphnia carinata]
MSKKLRVDKDCSSEDSSDRSSSEDDVTDETLTGDKVLERDVSDDSSGSASKFCKQIKDVGKNPIPVSDATLPNRCKSIGAKGIQIMINEEFSFFKRYEQANQIHHSSLKCTTCLCQLFLGNPKNIQIHPVLGVLLCSACREFYDNAPFTKSVNGHDEYCRWCAEGCRAIRCETCSNVFCKACLRRCLGRTSYAEIAGGKCKWNCLVCNNLPIWAPRALARMVMTAINRRPCVEPILAAVDANDPAVWLPNMIDKVENLAEHCKKLAAKIRSGWAKENEEIQRKGNRSDCVAKETDKFAVIDCCRKLRRTVTKTHFNMKLLEKKIITKFKKTYGTITDIDIDVSREKSNSKLKSASQEDKTNVFKIHGFPDRDREREDFCESVECSPSLASNAPHALPLECFRDLANSYDKTPSRTKKSSDVNGKATKEEAAPELSQTECTNDSHSVAKSNSKMATLSNQNSKCLGSFEPSTLDLNEKARRDLLKDSTDSDSTHSSDSDMSLAQLQLTLRGKTNSRHSSVPSKDDPKLKCQCVVILNRITDTDITFVQAEKQKVDRHDQEIDLLMKDPLKIKRLGRMESESETDSATEKANQFTRGSPKPENPCAKKRRPRIVEMRSSSSSDDDIETNVEEITIPKFSATPLMRDREETTRQALLAPSDSDTDTLTSETENENSNNEVVVEPTKQNSPDHDNEKIIQKEKVDKEVEVVDLTCDWEETASVSNIETDKLLSMSLHDPEAKTNGNREDKKTKKEAKRRGKKKRRDQSNSDAEISESGIENMVKRIRLSSSADERVSDDGDDDSANEALAESSSPVETKQVATGNSRDSSDLDGEDLNTSQRSETSTSKGRKTIRKIMADTSLTDETKAAAREEENRKRRIAERQKFYNEAFVCSSAVAETQTNSLVLDFDPVTKEELITVDKRIVSKLKLHQVQGIKFMWDACFESVERLKQHPGSGCILAHCMGLGKTLQVVTLVHTVVTNKMCQVDRVLVVCPVNTILNWVNEFKIWLGTTSGVDVYEITTSYSKNSNKDAIRVQTLSRWFKGGGVLVIGYAMYLHLTSENSKVVKPQEERDLYMSSLVDPGPHLVVCDEGHCLKNEKTASYEALNKIASRRRIVLTGTPLQNNLEEYFCMVQFVKPNLLGTVAEFKNRFANPIKNGQAADSTDDDVKLMKRRAHVLHKMLQDSVQRFDYRVLTPFLPPKYEYVISIKLSEIQTQMYQYYLENHTIGGPKHSSRIKATGLFADYRELSRIWTHPKALHLAAVNHSKAKIKSYSDTKTTNVDATGEAKQVRHSYVDHGEPSVLEDGDELACLDIDSEKESRKALNSSVAHDSGMNQTATDSEPGGTTSLPWWSQFCQMDMAKMELGGKFVLLMDILRQCEFIGDKVLVFSQSLVSLNLIEEFLAIENERQEKNRTSVVSNEDPVGRWKINRDYFRLDGQTSSEMRSNACNIFNNPLNLRARLFLISTRAGGIGINLIAANRVIIFDASWNPSHDAQSIFRVYRFGQQKPCYIYRFLAQGTMEEKIYDRQVTKLSLSCRVVDEQQIERHFNSADLKYLYLFEPDSHLRRPTPMVPKDRLLAELIIQRKEWIVTYHEHDSLLENKSEEELTEAERKAAWDDFENEKCGASMGNDFPVLMNMPGRLSDIFEALVGRTVAGVPLTSVASLIYHSNPNISQEDFIVRLRMTVDQMETFSAHQAIAASVDTLAGQRHGDSGSPSVLQRLLATDQNEHVRSNSPQRTASPGHTGTEELISLSPYNEAGTTAPQ